MSSSFEDEADGPQSLWARRGFVLAALFVGLLVVAAVVLFTLPGSDADPVEVGQGRQTTGGAAPSPTPTATEPESSSCDLPAGDQTVPVVAPTETQWELVGEMVAPTAPELHGPAVSSPVRSCFARTPVGALYAAVNVAATTTLPNAERILTEDLGAEGAGRDVALENLPTEGSSAGPSSEAQVQVAGFSFLSYTEDETVIDLAMLAATREQVVTVHTPVTLRWEQGDWRLVFGPEGAPFPRLQAAPSLAGYVPWSGT
ncbi:hypothetical protein [Aquipuribacter hungaricus]|uniref:DUF8175 domain-containing protein n=1 Tax=Aquipuribacter hungaricus TaxID=545624 RepID=A0ABV7WN43_9MICO